MKPAYRLRHVAADGETGPRDRGHVARDGGWREHAARVLKARAAVYVARLPPVAHHDARVLDGPVLEYQQRTDDADIFAAGVLGDAREPTVGNRYGVVVQKYEDIAPRLRHGQVIEARPIEFDVGIEHPKVLPFAPHARQPRRRFRFLRPVVHHGEVKPASGIFRV